VRKTLYVFCLWLAVAALPALGESYSFADGGSVTGDVFKADDFALTLHLPDDTYTNFAWPRFSQEALKQLAENPKVEKSFVLPFLAAQPIAKLEITVKSVQRLKRPENPSVLAGIFTSSIGLFILFVLYLANLYAAYEISIAKARSAGQVIGTAAVLPVIAPIIFLWLPIRIEVPAEQKEAEAVAAEVAAAQQEEKIQIAEASWKTDEASQAVPKKMEPQIFPRGKFTFNKRFIETRFADFANGGELAKKYSMELRTMKDQLAVERIAQIGQNEMILETASGQVTVPFSDIQEVKLNPKHA
jgi:Ni,Fe-hydrogenase III component G